MTRLSPVNRLGGLPTLKIDPAESLGFRYRGTHFSGVRGDTIASALFANGVRIFGRSLKYHRPRGLYSLDGESSNTLMTVNGVPNVRCENTPLEAGMAVAAQNVKGSAENDRLGFLDRLDFLMPAGFYYRVMHRPARLWPLAMKQIRKAAGLGKISPDHRLPGRYDEVFLNTDVCVIGAGPAGMTAALASARKGLRVILLESRPWPGGWFEYRSRAFRDGMDLHQRAGQLARAVAAEERIRLLARTPAVGTYNTLVTGVQTGGPKDAFDQRYVEILARSVVAAAGAIERPWLFEHNERPGVMQAACALRLARTWGLLPGRRAVFCVGHDFGLEAALALHDLGLDVACVADIREDGQDPALVQRLRDENIPFLRSWAAVRAHGWNVVSGATLSALGSRVTRRFACDLLVASAGFTPVTGHLTINRGTLAFDLHTGCFLPDRVPDGMHPAGRVLGLTDPRAIEASGRLAGLKAARDCGVRENLDIVDAEEALAVLPGPARGSKLVAAQVPGRKVFVCFDEDATVKHVRQAVDQGFDMPELIKRFTAASLGPGQGGIPGHNLPLLAAQYQALPGLSVRPTNVRPPLVPVLIAAYAGANRRMSKITPVDGLQREDGGMFRNMGAWQRARYFSKDLTCRQEIENVRTNVGMLDASSLGKFRIHGPDALNALQRVYVSDMTKVAAGRVKYSAMCNDDGCVMDDGVVTKLGENDYYLTTSSGRAGQTAEWIRYHTRYEAWDFAVVNLTDAMGVINLSGPNARKVLAKVADTDVSNEAFGFAGYREFTLGGTVPVRALRLGFTGELSFELHVPSSYMESVWTMIREAGRPFNIMNFGVEAQNVLRLEKCHIILGQESEQRTNLLDLGLGFLWDRDKAWAKTVGAVALRQAEGDPDRLKLAGFEMEGNGRAPRDGSLIVDDRIRGYVATARDSFSLNRAVGLALVEAPLAGTGTRIGIYEDECGGRLIYGRVVETPFYDPEGKRMRM